MIVDGLGKRVRETDTQAAGEPSSQSKLRGVIVRITAIVEISDPRELLIRSQLQRERVVLHALSERTGGVELKIRQCRRLVKYVVGCTSAKACRD